MLLDNSGEQIKDAAFLMH